MDTVREKVLEDGRLTVQETATDMRISIESVCSILTEDLRLLRVLAKFVPKLLTKQQKKLRKEISKNIHDFENHDPEFMKTIITNDETWFVITTQKPSFNPYNGRYEIT